MPEGSDSNIDEEMIDSTITGTGSVDLRHFTAFKQVYMARDYTAAAHDLNTSRKGILRMMDRLEKTFHSALFVEHERGTLTPKPFAERLFNDLRHLDTARLALESHINAVRKAGRVIRIGSSVSIFRTRTFRNLFREMQTFEQVRASYVALKPDDASKALAAGTCDVHVGCFRGNPKRVISIEVGTMSYCVLVRKSPSAGSNNSGHYYVSVDGLNLDNLTGSEDESIWKKLEERQFLDWLDHPEECPPGTRILAPDIPRNPLHWEIEPSDQESPHPIYINFLRQHPYEFLPSLGHIIQTRLASK